MWNLMKGCQILGYKGRYCQLRNASDLARQVLTPPKNEAILDYSDPNSNHRVELDACLKGLESQVVDVPIIIKGKEYRTNEIRQQVVPFDHKRKLAQFYYATHELIQKAAHEAAQSRRNWENTPISSRLAMTEKAADLVAGKYRQKLNSATMLGQAKTIKQAEIDSAAELADFLRFNAYFMRQLLELQPVSTEYEHNSTVFRGLDGFVAAISPFNFTAIGGNLVAAPALLGNSVVWKPSDSAMLSNYITLQVLREAGFPDEVISFVPSEGIDFGRLITGSSDLAGINFTGSLSTFQWLTSEVGLNIKRYKSFPRLVGECGGKNFHLIHQSADVETATVQTVRSAFEYSGQKCSACSRLYVPKSMWNSSFKDKLVSLVKNKVKIAAANEYDAFTSAVINKIAFDRIASYISYAKANKDELEIICGGNVNDEIGYFIEPTIVETKNPNNRLMHEEIFGPVLTVYAYPDSEIDKTLELIDANNFALTGAIFAQDETFIEKAKVNLRMSAGNLYINDKSTGAVVGQQPFGGSRHSGTNDKAGGVHYLMRWCNQQTIKRTVRQMTDL